MSGQGEIIDKVLRDFEDCGGLAPSGSTNIEDLLAASKLSLLVSNVDETSDPRQPTEEQRIVGKGLLPVPSNVDQRSQNSTDKPRPNEEQERLQAKLSDTENKPWEY
ncbi:hypothetical protein N7462_008613 [Penicillium macrosclerotiorum]|uniref:uncharacterized protein n=1 Tax=Penicillium macrosclerotiorum TaxID=303699 RepID=UPI0025498622|nr:uncharacterized protein N7462_008613 [Penicillium macrosclerotiorum]KAJ5675716.1 hypothetical protein N7462_008613 [Penicillium macrosclerotiorum]